MTAKIKKILKQWLGDEKGVAAMEAVFVFPILTIMLLGIYDLGNAILTNQKTLRASQVTADLVARHKTVSSVDVDDAVLAGTLAIEPFDTTNYGVDVVSVRFDENEIAQIVWRETVNMPSESNVLSRLSELAEPNGGAVMVISRYVFKPLFSGFFIDEIPMEEVAFTKGRTSTVVNFE